MIVRWTSRANVDLARLHDFLVDKSPAAAGRVAQMLARAPERLRDFPRIGMRLENFPDGEVRRLIVGDYEIRYEILGDTIWVLQLWHCREDR
ncbi:MAG TPA: type II toxin-antitoxin system RelE/ParE family toxin [Caulobacteraceae bacterium]|nr:type II toxin-antitoxin system RelE/ParE family toxin [Caulobacteraceae bacterium]